MRKALNVFTLIVTLVTAAATSILAYGSPVNDVRTPIASGEPSVRESPVAGSAQAPNASDVVASRLRRLSTIDLDEVVWLARCIYSESDRANEQELVAWVVRNRVETQYRGRTYREVVLEVKQFSAFNEPSKRREHILNLDHETPLRSWRRALKIALDVYQAPASDRPFAQTVRHFYSPVSMVGGRTPHWADRDKALSSARLGVDRRRFVFFDDVDEHLARADGFTPPSRSGNVRRAGYEDDGGGFKLKLPKPSGKVSRPRRPSVQTARSSRRP